MGCPEEGMEPVAPGPVLELLALRLELVDVGGCQLLPQGQPWPSRAMIVALLR